METNETPQAAPQQIPPPPAAAAPRPQLPQKSPILAGFLSILPGLGNVYNGLYRRGVSFFLVWVVIFGITTHASGRETPFLVMSLCFIWFFNMFDAYRQATLLNYGLTSDPEVLREQASDLGSWGLVPGVVLVLLGFYGVLREYFDLDLSWLVDQWPIAIMALGAWMIYQTLKQRKNAETSAETETSEI